MGQVFWLGPANAQYLHTLRNADFECPVAGSPARRPSRSPGPVITMGSPPPLPAHVTDEVKGTLGSSATHRGEVIRDQQDPPGFASEGVHAWRARASAWRENSVRNRRWGWYW